MASTTQRLDAVVIGAGFSGLHMLKSLRDKLGLKVRVYETGETVGGTWYWNRYPGARCDFDAYIYCFTWDKQLLQEWQWSERYPEQPEILRYLEEVAKRHDLKRDIQFNTSVTGAEFDEETNLWTAHTDKGETVAARYLIAAVGTLSATNLPSFKGFDLPPNFHPAAIRASAGFTPWGAGGATCDRRSWSGLRRRSRVAERLAA